MLTRIRLVSFLIIVLTLAVSASATVLFQDDFEDGLDPAWTIDNRTSHPDGMSVVDGRLVIHESTGYHWSSAFALVGDDTWTEYTVELEFTATSGAGALGITHHVVGDWSQIWDGIVGYHVDLGWNDQLKLNRQDGAGPVQLLYADDPPQDLALGVTYRLIAEIRDGSYRFRYFPVDAADPGWQHEVADDHYTSGYLAIHTWNTLGYIDNVRVTNDSPSTPTPTFTDISVAAGLPEEQMQASTMADLDHDGDLDLLAVRPSDLALLRFENQGGQFMVQNVTIDTSPDFWPATMQVLDFDRDGDWDLLASPNADGEQEIYLFRNEADSYFREPLDLAPGRHNHGRGPQVTDFDGDGWPDIVYHAVNDVGLDLVLLRNTGGAYTAEILLDRPSDHLFGDFLVFDMNRDGYPDVIHGSHIEAGCYSPGYRTAPVDLYLNDGGDGLLPAGDVGLPDMCLRGAFAAFDVDNDGWLDLANGTSDFICNGGQEKNWLLRNNGGEFFTDISDPSMNVGSHYYDRKHPADVDLDGDLDYFQQVETWTHARLFLNNADGTFAEISDAAGLTYAAGRDGGAENYWFDHDGDGDLDLLRTTRTRYPVGVGKILLFRNDIDAGNWLVVDPRPAQSAPSLVGLTVTAHCGTDMLTRTIIDFDSPMIHFGLGTMSMVDSLVVHWPASAPTVLTDVAAGQVVTIEETPLPPPVSLPYWENFDDGVADDFEVVSGNWQVIDGEYHCYNDENGTKHIAAFGDPGWSDYRVAMVIRAEGAPEHEFLFRYQDADNWYLFVALPDPYNRVALWKCVAGEQVLLAQINDVAMTPGEVHRLTVVAQGDWLTGYLADDQLFQVRDTNQPLLSGRIAVSAFADPVVGWSEVWIDRFAIIPIDMPVDVPPTDLDVVSLTSYPNPFNPATNLAFSLPSSSPVRLRVFDLRGRIVRNLLDEVREEGDHVVRWTGVDDSGRRMSSGTYIARLEACGSIRSRKLLVVK